MRVVACAGRRPDGTRCGEPTSNPSGRCHEHRPRLDRSRLRSTPRQRTYDTAAWRRLRRAVVSEWVASNGWECPGWRTPPHASRDLTADHVVPLVHGGAPLSRANVAVLCRPCQGRKALSQRRGRA